MGLVVARREPFGCGYFMAFTDFMEALVTFTDAGRRTP
jgi:hypothetical protein